MNGKFPEFLTLTFFFMQKIRLFFLLYASCSVSASAKTDLHFAFLKEFANHHNFYSSSYYLISCHLIDSINVMKSFSVSFRRFVNAHPIEKDLMPFKEEPQTFILDVGCSNAREILKQANDLHLLSKPFQWILLNKHEPGDKSKIFSENKTTWSTSHLEGLDVLIDSDIKIAERINDEKIKVISVYKLKDSLIEELLAEWSAKKGLNVLNYNAPSIRRWNLQGSKISASVVIFHPSSAKHLDDMVDRHIDTSAKASYNIIKLYGDLFNISIKFEVNTQGGDFVNGSWTGMVGDIERNKTEFGGTPLFFRKDRMNIVEYYAMVTPTRASFIFLSPPVSYSKNIFFLPFDTTVWYCCLGTVATSCFLLYVAIKFERNHLNGKESQNVNVSFFEILILNIGAISLQGTVARTQKATGRIITLFSYVAYMFLYISYSAAIVAILQSSDTSIQTLKDFLSSPLMAGAEDVLYNHFYFKTAEDEVRKAIYRKKIAPKNEPPHFLPLERGVEEIKKGFYGFHVELSGGYQLIQKTFSEEEKCALQELKESYIRFSDPWIVMKKNSPYSELLKIGIKKCIESGFKSRFVRQFYTKKPICSARLSRFVSVGIADCYYAFMLLLSGMSLAIGILTIESVFRKCCKERKIQNIGRVNVLPEYVFMN